MPRTYTVARTAWDGDSRTHAEIRYVMDDWGWQDQFLSNSYGSKTASGKFSDRYNVG